MTKIIDAYAGNQSISDALKSLGESMFGDEAKQEVLRETARKYRRENEAANQLPGLYAGGDPLAIGGQILRHNPNATNIGNVMLARTGAEPGITYEDPKLATAALSAGHNYEGTVPGVRESIAQKMAAAHEATTRAAAAQEAIAQRQLDAERWKFEHTPTTVYPTINGRVTPQIVPQSEAMGQGGKPLSKDEIVGNVLQSALEPSANQWASVTDRINAANGGRDPFSNLSNDVRHMAGLPSFSQEQNLQNARDELARTDIPQLGPRPLVQNTQAGQDVYAGGGLSALAKNLGSETWNAIFGTDYAPDLHKSINNISNLAARARVLPISGVSRDSTQREKWNSANIPQPGALGVIGGGGEEQQAKLMAFLTRLRTQYGVMRDQAMSPATPPVEREKLRGQLNELRNVIEEYEKPVAGGAGPTASAPAQATPQAAQPAARPRAVNKQTGEQIEWNGNAWVPIQ